MGAPKTGVRVKAASPRATAVDKDYHTVAFRDRHGLAVFMARMFLRVPINARDSERNLVCIGQLSVAI